MKRNEKKTSSETHKINEAKCKPELCERDELAMLVLEIISSGVKETSEIQKYIREQKGIEYSMRRIQQVIKKLRDECCLIDDERNVKNVFYKPEQLNIFSLDGLNIVGAHQIIQKLVDFIIGDAERELFKKYPEIWLLAQGEKKTKIPTQADFEDAIKRTKMKSLNVLEYLARIIPGYSRVLCGSITYDDAIQNCDVLRFCGSNGNPWLIKDPIILLVFFDLNNALSLIQDREEIKKLISNAKEYKAKAEELKAKCGLVTPTTEN
ncbi:hypothetical protein SJAV_13180 [Sulfurisphaera javensis]|uniref:Uncharacterized protein n=1 Tax=Sulfurisphaera javensis TaxID=2049879 RepID=A0AAT9GRR4_9CREN